MVEIDKAGEASYNVEVGRSASPGKHAMDDSLLFELPPRASDQTQEARVGRRRLRTAVRDQIAFQSCSLNDLLPEDHQARLVWRYVEGLDLTPLIERVQAVECGPGQAPADPRILLALWLYATLRGIGSARELNRRCTSDVAFKWICGGVSMNYHTLADFRTAHVEFLDRLLTQSVAVLLAEDLVTLDRVAQDGVKVRASAGASSFRRKTRLEQCHDEAATQIEALRTELESDQAAASARQKAARLRAAEEREERLRRALEQLPQVEAGKKKSERDKARVSTTDPDARVMKMADGGFRPAYNVQIASSTQGQVIVGLSVTNSGGDQGQLAPMADQIEQRHGQRPAEMLADGGFVKKEDIDRLQPPRGGTKVFAPVMPSKDPGRAAHTPREDDSSAVAEWRTRMATAEAKEIYKQRASTAECVNAQARNRGLRQFVVRGLEKIRAVMLWFALAHNLIRTLALRAAIT